MQSFRHPFKIGTDKQIFNWLGISSKYVMYMDQWNKYWTIVYTVLAFYGVSVFLDYDISSVKHFLLLIIDEYQKLWWNIFDSNKSRWIYTCMWTRNYIYQQRFADNFKQDFADNISS